MHEDSWEVKLDKLQELLRQSIEIHYDRVGQFSSALHDVVANMRKLFTFVFTDDYVLTDTQQIIALPADRCWFQFIEPIKISRYPGMPNKVIQIYGILLMQSRANQVTAFILTKSDDRAEYKVHFHTLKTKNVLPEQQELFTVLANCALLAKTQAYMFKNFDRVYVKRVKPETQDLTVHYAPKKIGIVGTERYQIVLQYPDHQEIAPLSKFDPARTGSG